ncbi:MAG: hypothetical protein KF811_03840 [Dokdonella sp.]|nr:hypothetical protein [Dokdonella sp.]MCB1574844.1 hypothetical protein [Xanthomonadales bacterium]MCB1578495.1 hypothetical protein [Xanthomonadales bacterium]
MPRLARLFATALVLAALCSGAGPVLAAGDASSALFDAYAKMINSRCVAETVATDAKGRESRSQVEFDTINRIRVSTDQASFIVLPEGTWMRTGGGEWTKPPIDMSAMFKRLVPSTLEEIRAGTRNIRDEGMQTVDGQNLRAVSYDVNTQVMGIDVSSHNTVFIDASGRIVRSVSDGEAMGHKTHSVQTIRYDDSIRISAPD